jgi:hypothetical protein
MGARAFGVRRACSPFSQVPKRRQAEASRSHSKRFAHSLVFVEVTVRGEFPRFLDRALRP